MSSAEQGFFKDQFITAQGLNSMASAERQPITGVSGGTPSGGPPPPAVVQGAEPPVGVQGS